MNDEVVRIPERFCRNEIVHRAMRGTDPEGTTLGCGFMMKLDGRGQHHNFSFPQYSGVLVLRGKGTYIDWAGREYPTFPGCFFQRLPGRTHSTIHPDTPVWAECYVNISQSFCETLAEMNSLDVNKPVLVPGLSLVLVERFDSLLNDLRNAPPIELPRMLALAHALIADIYALDRHGSRPNPYSLALDEAARVLATDVSRRIKLPVLATQLGLGYEVFRKAFHDRFGMAPGDYSIRRRMERARSLLTQGEVTVKEVAFALGYPNEFAFSRQFSRVYGAPPSRFRGMP
jgi:AraC family transcriptional regulator of arabinose operon